jgi:hypothetical protein
LIARIQRVRSALRGVACTWLDLVTAEQYHSAKGLLDTLVQKSYRSVLHYGECERAFRELQALLDLGHSTTPREIVAQVRDRLSEQVPPMPANETEREPCLLP